MRRITSTTEIRTFLRDSSKTKDLGFVPTMGALHDGHVALIRRSVEENDQTVLSIFINPTQFNNPNDLSTYPSNRQKDLDRIYKIYILLHRSDLAALILRVRLNT